MRHLRKTRQSSLASFALVAIPASALFSTHASTNPATLTVADGGQSESAAAAPSDSSDASAQGAPADDASSSDPQPDQQASSPDGGGGSGGGQAEQPADEQEPAGPLDIILGAGQPKDQGDASDQAASDDTYGDQTPDDAAQDEAPADEAPAPLVTVPTVEGVPTQAVQPVVDTVNAAATTVIDTVTGLAATLPIVPTAPSATSVAAEVEPTVAELVDDAARSLAQVIVTAQVIAEDDPFAPMSQRMIDREVQRRMDALTLPAFRGTDAGGTAVSAQLARLEKLFTADTKTNVDGVQPAVAAADLTADTVAWLFVKASDVPGAAAPAELGQAVGVFAGLNDTGWTWTTTLFGELVDMAAVTDRAALIARLTPAPTTVTTATGTVTSTVTDAAATTTTVTTTSGTTTSTGTGSVTGTVTATLTDTVQATTTAVN